MKIKLISPFVPFTALLFLLLFTVSDAEAQAKEVQNILKNPDFEVDTNGWSIGAGGILQIDKKEKSPTGHNVVKAIVDAVGANAWEPEIHSPAFDLVNGKTYTYAFWAKTEDGKTRTLSCRFEQLDTWVGIGQDVLINDQWKDYHFTGVWTHPSSPPQVVIHIALNVPPAPLADAWLCHFRVYEGNYIEEQVGGKPRSVDQGKTLSIAWGRVKSY